MIAGEQAVLYSLAAEEWSRRILKQDSQNSPIDHLNEDWAIELPALPVEGGTIKGKLTDLQACFNLNSLYQGSAINPVAQARFKTLLKNLALETTIDLSQAIVDWIDKDLDTSIPDGAEDGYYLNLEKPYRVANAPIQSISELRLIKGFESVENYDALKPFVCAFGVSAPINVNTAPAEVIRSLASDLSASDVENIIAQRDEDPFDDMNELLNFNNLKDIIKVTDELSTNSEYFLLETESLIGNARTMMYSVIHRDNKGDTEVISRSLGAW